MEFRTEAQKQCYEKIKPWVREIFGDFAAVPEDRPVFVVNYGSAVAMTAVYPWGDGNATICSRAYVCTGAELTPEFMHYLLAKNDSMRFGAFGVDEDDDVFFEHTIAGNTCDREELKSSIMAVVTTADLLDDEIVARWGGTRAVDQTK